jgi:hypothetical protein
VAKEGLLAVVLAVVVDGDEGTVGVGFGVLVAELVVELEVVVAIAGEDVLGVIAGEELGEGIFADFMREARSLSFLLCDESRFKFVVTGE